MTIVNIRDEQLIGQRVKVATSFFARFRGLMLAAEPGEGLLLAPCNSIHMMFMRFPIDAVFLDAGNKVVALYEGLLPWFGLSGWHRDVSSVLELKSGTIKKTGIRVSDTLRMERTEC